MIELSCAKGTISKNIEIRTAAAERKSSVSLHSLP